MTKYKCDKCRSIVKTTETVQVLLWIGRSALFCYICKNCADELYSQFETEYYNIKGGSDYV